MAQTPEQVQLKTGERLTMHGMGTPPKIGEKRMIAGCMMRAKALLKLRCEHWAKPQPHILWAPVAAKPPATGVIQPPTIWTQFLQALGLADWRVRLHSGTSICLVGPKELFVDVRETGRPTAFLHVLAHTRHAKHGEAFDTFLAELTTKYRLWVLQGKTAEV
jgi:hypothetical protein